MPIGIPKGYLDPPPVPTALQVPATAREGTIALLAAGGCTPAEIAARLKLSLRLVTTALAKPTVIALVEDCRRTLLAEAGTTVQDTIQADGPRNVKRLQDLRDQDADLKVALAAAKELLARQSPVHTVHHEDKVVRIVLQAGDLKAIQDAVVEVTAREVTDATP